MKKKRGKEEEEEEEGSSKDSVTGPHFFFLNAHSTGICIWTCQQHLVVHNGFARKARASFDSVFELGSGKEKRRV